jgi:hypothetical protein
MASNISSLSLKFIGEVGEVTAGDPTNWFRESCVCVHEGDGSAHGSVGYLCSLLHEGDRTSDLSLYLPSFLYTMINAIQMLNCPVQYCISALQYTYSSRCKFYIHA